MRIHMASIVRTNRVSAHHRIKKGAGVLGMRARSVAALGDDLAIPVLHP